MLFAETFNIKTVVKQALEEDDYAFDLTTKGLSLGDFKTTASIIAKEEGVCAGIGVAAEVFRAVDKNLRFTAVAKDGQRFKAGDTVAKISGKASSILTAERTALNFLARLCGIATLTRKFVDAAKPSKAKILDTRKTTPGLRVLEKYAVRMGGGYNHRMSLRDAVLVKDNHIAVVRKKEKSSSLYDIVSRERMKTPNEQIQVEVDTLSDFKEALSAKPYIIMLDNMSMPEMRACVRLRNQTDERIQLEISGNVTTTNIAKLAKLGVERISIGSLTHSPKSIDMSLQVTT